MSIATDYGYLDSSQGLTWDECVPFMCGAPGSLAQKEACSNAGYAGVFGCSEPPCVSSGNGCPAPSIPASSVPRVTQAQIGTTSKFPSGKITHLTPQTLVQPLPNITSSLAPAPVSSNCTPWDELNQAISDHPVIAIAALAGLYLLLKGRR
jgi:hypothetical protein